MTKEIFINCTATETRLALTENGVLQQIHIDRQENPSLVGNIYKAKVLRVMPGLQAAFVDIGHKRNAFIHIDHIHRVSSGDRIGNILRDGQELLVQVLKDPVNEKGALLTTDLSIANGYFVYRQGRTKPGVSLQIKDSVERARLGEIVNSMLPDASLPERFTGNFILRSAAEGATETELAQELQNIISICQTVDSLRVKKSPTILHSAADQKQHLVTSMLKLGIDKIITDSPDFLEKIKSWFEQSPPSHQPEIELFQQSNNLFDTYRLEEQINAALCSIVELDCGGYLVVEETEALVAVDVNSGSFIGKSTDQSTYVEVNLEAAVESARQIRLRNLSGIIIIDFIDMHSDKHRHQVLQQLRQSFSQDSTKTVISDFTELGLVQIARKRKHPSLSQVLCAHCGQCDARGYVKSDATLSFEILRQLWNLKPNRECSTVEIYASEAVIEKLENKYAQQVNEFKVKTNCDVKLCTEHSISSEQFKIIPV